MNKFGNNFDPITILLSRQLYLQNDEHFYDVYEYDYCHFIFLSRGSAITLCSPISVVKSNMEGNHIRVYSGIVDGLTTITRTQGIRGLFAGLVPSLVKDCPYMAVYNLLNNRLKEKVNLIFFTHYERSSSPSKALNNSINFEGYKSPLLQFGCASTSAIIATTIFYPLEVIKTRLQLYSTIQASSQSLNNFPASANVDLTRRPSSKEMTKIIWQEGGMTAFFKGLSPRLLRRSLNTGLTWMMQEQIVLYLTELTKKPLLS